MAASSGLPLPLALLCLVLIRDPSALLASPGVHPTGEQPPQPTTKDPFLTPEDYSLDQDPFNTDAPITPPSTSNRTLERCDYNPCVENQTPCQQQAAVRGCLCPGFTLPDQAPLPPNLRSLAWNGSQVVVHWCAPHSHVTRYLATVGGTERGQFGAGQRSGGLGAVNHMTEVCLSAVNEVGASKSMCHMYVGHGGGGLLLALGLVGGILGFLLITLVAILLWRRRRQKQRASGRQ